MKPKYEVVPHELNSSIHAFNYQKERFDSPWHYHGEYELVYICQSSGVRYVGSSIQNFKAGDLILMGSSLPHVWKNSPDYQAGASSIYIQWNQENLSNIFNQIAEFSGIQRLLENATKGIRFIESHQTGEIAAKMQMLLEFKGARKILAFADILFELSELKDFELLTNSADEFAKREAGDHRVETLISHIDEHYHEKINMQDVADLTYMTKVSFCKYFKKQFNKTFTEYLNEVRIRKICQSLQDTNLGVSQLALENGYENLSFFHRQFKKYVNLTPAKYRETFDNL